MPVLVSDIFVSEKKFIPNEKSHASDKTGINLKEKKKVKETKINDAPTRKIGKVKKVVSGMILATTSKIL